jgi:hypothetical protein
VREDVSRKIEVEFPYRDIDVIWIYTEVGVKALTGLLKSLSISRFEGNCFEQNDHHKIQSPNFIRLTKTVDSSHLALLVGVGEDAGYVLLAGDTINKVFSAFLGDVLAKLPKEPRCPLLFDIDLLILIR